MTTDNRAEPMKPCPFCGQEPSDQYHERFGIYRIFCDEGPDHSIFIGGDTEVEAIAAWNRRAELEASRLPLAGAGDAAVQQPVAWQEPGCPRHVISAEDKRDELDANSSFVQCNLALRCSIPLYALPTAPAGAREAMQKALDALKVGWVYASNSAGGSNDADTIHSAIVGLRAALAAAPLERIARMLTEDEITECYGHHSGVRLAITVQRKFAEVNGITLAPIAGKGDGNG